MNKTPLNVAFDKMLRDLNIKAKDVSEISQVSPSRLSQFRNGNGGDIGVRSLDALLDAAQSLNPRAKGIFANYIAEVNLKLDRMTLAEKGKLIIALGKSVQTGISTDSKTD
ncbi:MAG: hypothetical protein AAFR63_12445 [Cyanobacteria bacterium J06631_6]